MNVFRAIVGFAVLVIYGLMLLAGFLAYFVPGKRRDNLRQGFGPLAFAAVLTLVCVLPALCGALLLDMAANA